MKINNDCQSKQYVVSLRGYYRKSLKTNPHLICPWQMRHHMPLELGMINKRVATQRQKSSPHSSH